MRVVIGDGAEWIWNVAHEQFPGAIQIVDLYPLPTPWDLARKLHPTDEKKQKAWIKIHQKRLLDKGNIEKLVNSLRAIQGVEPELADKIRTEADYFERNAERMRYPKFRAQHLFVGSSRSGSRHSVAASLCSGRTRTGSRTNSGKPTPRLRSSPLRLPRVRR